MNRSETLSKLAVALVKAQAEIGAAVKSAKNPFFKSNYANLEEVIETAKGPLNKHGIVFLQIVNESERGAVVETTLLHESGEFLSGCTPVVTAKQNDPQALGSAITYAKRYGLQAICGIPSADDDGESAMQRKPKVSPTVELLELVKKLKKSPKDIESMLKFVGAEGELADLPAAKALKLVGILRKQ